MFVCRRSADKVVVFVTTTGQITIDANGLTSVNATEFSGTEPGWATPDYEVKDLTGMEIELPADYYGEAYKLIEDGASYRFEAA
jgi:hypothetical protein